MFIFAETAGPFFTDILIHC